MADILIADDDELLAELVRFKLEGAGHRVTISGDGASALALARQHRYELVVLDAMMPVMSGLDVLRSLSEEQPELPVVMLTARKASSDVLAALNGGARDYLTKPFIPDELVVRVNSILRTRARVE
ncbi:response regulator transcription factor [Sphingobium bisphenolivorans]|uniref:response regulator transcription factor n=1 Tax=Sphingobium bisphenolivorans TaxID=1335760 RepID=UPI00039EA380|nr:response regulator [Sphingobium bisphenolivorans]